MAEEKLKERALDINRSISMQFTLVLDVLLIIKELVYMAVNKLNKKNDI